MRYRLILVVLGVAAALVVPVGAAGGVDSLPAGAFQESPIEFGADESPIGVEDPQPPLPSTAAEGEPAPEGVTLGDSDEVKVAVPAESIRMALPFGDHLATPVLGDRVAVADLPLAVVTDVDAFGRGGQLPAVRVRVDASQPVDVPGALSPLFTVDFVDAADRVVTPATPASLEVDVSWLPGGLYGNLRDRLVLKWFEGCRRVDVLVDAGTVDEESVTQTTCDRVIDLPTEHDRDRGVLVVSLDPTLRAAGDEIASAATLDGVPLAGLLAFSGSSSGIGLGSDYSSEQGSWGATPLTNTASYQVGLFTGSFETAYPFAVPPSAAGPVPSVGLAYSSGSIDGMATDTNTQASTVGLGWSLAAGGSITRHYKTCGDSVTAPGDLCPLGHEYTLSLNGTGSRLVLEDETTSGAYEATFRLEADPLWRIQLFNEDSTATVSNPDSHDEYWVVTTPDGTRYEFGTSNDSVDWVPVYTANQSLSEFDCDGYEDGAWSPLTETCQKAWRWNLSEVVDTSGNTISYSYLQEANWYGLRKGNEEAEYVNASHLREVLYTDNGTGLNPRARVLFHTEVRCDDPLSTTKCDDDTDFIDTPIDLVCRDDENCGVYNERVAPSFFSERRLDAVETQVKVGSDWDTVQWWTLDQLFPDGTNETVDAADSEPKLWLDEITNRPDLTTDDDGRVAYVQIEMEDFDYKSGSMGKKPASDYGSGQYLNAFGGSDYVRFNDVDFGDGAASILIRYAKADTGGVIRFRTGSSTGPEFAAKWPASTGGWQEWDTISKSIASSPTGVHDVYVTVDNSSEVAHLNWIRLVPDTGTLDGLPPTDYDLVHLQNRAEDEDDIADRGASPMRMPRIDEIILPLGGVVNVTYGTPHGWNTDPSSGPCHEDAVYGEDERLACHFYGTRYDGEIVRYAKYVVTEIETDDPDVENQKTYTRYDYSRPAWRYSDVPGYHNFTTGGSCATEPCNRWSVFRGHEWVKVTMHDGASTDYATTEHRFYQGMDDDYVYSTGQWNYSVSIDILDPTDNGSVESTRDDYRWLVGRPSQTITYDGTYSGALSNTETTYVTYTTTDADGQHQGRYVAVDIVETDTYGTATLSTKVDYNYEALGSTSPHTDRIVRLTKQSHHGDVDDTADDRMTVYTNTTANTTDWIIALPATVKVRDGLSGNDTLLSEVNYHYDYDVYDDPNALGTVGSDGLLAKTETKLNSTEDAVTLYTYDSYGRIDFVTDAAGDHKVDTDYDGTYGYITKVTNIGDPDTTTNPDTDIVEYDAGFGVPLEVDDANDNRITAEYDEYGRLTEVWLPTEDPASDPATIKYEYTIDPTDYPAFVKTSQLTDADGSGTYLDSWTFYDGFGGVAQTQQPSASDGKHWIVSTGYTDKQGVLRRQAAPFERVLTTAVSGDPDYHDPFWTGASMPPLHTVYTYDVFGRVTDTETIADDSSPNVLWSTETAYDVVSITGAGKGIEQTFTDEEDAVIEQVTDAFGNLVRVHEYDNTTKITTKYDYDGLNRLIEVIDTDGNDTDITYDIGGRKKTLDDPDMGSWSYTYDVFGNLTSQTDGRTQKLVFDYDEYDRLIAKYDTSISPSNLLAEWDYDASGQLGLLDKSIAYESVGGTDYTITVDPQTYDARGRVTKTQWDIDGDTYTVEWAYDRADRIDTITYPTVDGDTEVVTYTYDDDNRGLADELTWKEDDQASTSEDLVTAATWDALGRPLTQTWGSGTYEFDRVWAYESDTLRLDKIQAGDNASSNDIVNLSYQYYDDGNIKYLTDFRNSSQKQCFEYDDLKRLTTAYTLSGSCTGHANWDDTVGSGPYRRLYDYENNGNIDQVAGDTGTYQSYTYPSNGTRPHAVTAYDGWTYTYDKNGNLNTRTKTGQPTEDAAFNANNQMESYDVGSDTTEFVYDADGTRVIRIDDPNVGSTITTHYIGGVFEVTNPGTTPDETRSYYTFNGTTIGYRLWTSTSDDRNYLVADHLGSNAAQVDEATGTITEQRYLPFGDLRAATSNGLDTDRTYTGQISDESTGLMFYNARYYLPELRRFISADTIIPDPANPQNLNRYTYVANAPTNLADPSGYSECGGWAFLTNFFSCLWEWEREQVDESMPPLIKDIGTGAVNTVRSIIDNAEYLKEVLVAAAYGDFDPLRDAVAALPGEVVDSASYLADLLDRASSGDGEALGELAAGSIFVVGGRALFRHGGGGGGGSSPAGPIRRVGLVDASDVANQAARNVSSFRVTGKHQPSAGGTYAKFDYGVDQHGSIREALTSDAATFRLNYDKLGNVRDDSFVVVTDVGRSIGRRGETGLKVVLGNDGTIWTAYPVNP